MLQNSMIPILAGHWTGFMNRGPKNIFSGVSQCHRGFKLDTRHHHYDTTSVTVYGDYDDPEASLKITYGYSKDKRPDLKQFLVSMLCVDRNIPIIGKTEDGNASDKTLNNEILTNISAHMAEYGFAPGASIYIADSAFVTAGNLSKTDEDNIRFLSRLPANFSGCKSVISEAVLADKWQDIGTMAESYSEKGLQPSIGIMTQWSTSKARHIGQL